MDAQVAPVQVTCYALAERRNRGAVEAMGDQPEDLYTHATGASEPANWSDATPSASPRRDTAPASAAEYPTPYQASGAEAPYEASVTPRESAAGGSYGAADGFSGWSPASEAERRAT